MFCADGISITLLTLLSVSLAGITMFRKKPREILSEMS
jgi:putative ABC transport system permease protein